jgi:hypothetical protein
LEKELVQGRWREESEGDRGRSQKERGGSSLEIEHSEGYRGRSPREIEGGVGGRKEEESEGDRGRIPREIESV